MSPCFFQLVQKARKFKAYFELSRKKLKLYFKNQERTADEPCTPSKSKAFQLA